MKQRFALLVFLLSLITWLSACGSGAGTIGSVTDPKPTVSIKASPTTVNEGQTVTLSVTSSNATSCTGSGAWSGSVPCNGSQTVTPNSAGTLTYTVAATGSGGSASASVQVTVNGKTQKLSVSVSPTSASVKVNGTVPFDATVMNGDGNATVTWSATAGTVSPTTGPSTTYTAPAKVPSGGTATVTATAKDSTGTATATATATITMPVTLSLTNLPNGEIYSDIGDAPALNYQCSGCTSSDVLEIQSTYGSLTQTSFSTALNFIGNAFIPGPISAQVYENGTPVSNIISSSFDGGAQNYAVIDPSTGEIYYYYPGTGADSSAKILVYKSDDALETTYSNVLAGSPAFGYDPGTGYVFLTDYTGIGAAQPGKWSSSGGTIPVGEVSSFTINNGYVCALQVQTDTAYFFAADQAGIPQSQRTIATITFPSGSQPVAAYVLSSSSVVILTRGDSTLHWFSISGSAATQTATLQLTDFTPVNSSYTSTDPNTGAWGLVEVKSSSGAQIIGALGTVLENGKADKELALVDANNHTLNQYVSLPSGADRIAADPTSNAILVGSPDLSASPIVTKLEDVDAGTGVVSTTVTTSQTVPGVGLVPTLDGTHVAVCVEGGCDFPPKP